MKNRKTMNLQKRVTAFFLTMLMFFSCFGEGISTVVEAAEVSSTEHHIYGYGYDFSNSGLRKAYDPTTQKNDDTAYQYKWCTGYWYYFTNERGEICYCLELGVKHYDSVKQMELDFKTIENNEVYSKYFNSTQREWLKFATVYGYKGTTHYGYSWEEELIATQMLVWSVSAKYYDTTKNELGVSETKMLNCLRGSSLNKSHIKDIWQKMKSNIRNHRVRPSKTSEHENEILSSSVHKLSYNAKNNKWEKTVKFDNYLDMFSLSSLSGVTMTKKNTDSNYRDDSLVISASKVSNFKNKIVKLTKSTSMQGFKIDKCSPLILIAKAQKATQMKVSYYNQDDPVHAYFALTSDTGNIELHKKFTTGQGQSLTMTDAWRNAVEFKLKYTYGGKDYYVIASGSNGNYTFTSANTTDASKGTTFKLDSNGNIKVKDVPTGKYVSSEVKVPDGFKLSADNEIVVNYNQTTKLDVTNRQNTTQGASLSMTKVIQDVNGNTNSYGLTDIYNNTKFIASVKLDSGKTVYFKNSRSISSGVYLYSGNITDRGENACLTENIEEAEKLTVGTSSCYGDIIMVFPTATGNTGMVEVTKQKNPVTLTEVQSGYGVGITGSDKVYLFPDKDAQLKNREISLQINIKKLDSETNEYVAGAEFTITANKDYPDYNLNAGDEICKIITDENGYATTQSASDESGVNAKLYEGIEYKIKETAVPTNYVATNWEQTFTVDINPDTSIQYQKVSFDVTNDWQQGTIKVIKVDNDNNEYALSGAEFGIYANDDIKIWNDEESKYDTYVTGDLIETVITGDDGSAETVKRYPVAHSFTIKELKAPFGYNKAEDRIVTMPYNQTVVNSETTAVIGDDRQQGKIRVYKVDKEDNEKKLAGAVFNVVASEDIIVHGVKLYDKGAVIETITTGEDGSADTSSLYTGFKYSLDEVKAPDGYILSGSKEISLDYDNQIEYVEAQTSVENAPTEVTITKKDFSTGELIPNCGIEILDESKNVLVQGRTDDKGEVTFKRLPMGNYYYREYDAPEGYYLDTTPYPFTIGEDGIFKAEMTNKLQELVLNIFKTDGETKKALAGAEFTVYDNDGNELGKVTTGEDGNASTRGNITMYAGREYIVRETKAPQGYKASNFEQKFSSDYNCSIEYHEVNISVENAPTEVTITKTDFSTGELIPDCGIEILDEDKNVIVQGRTDEKGEVTFKRLPVGKYYYREFDAPKGYYLDPTPYAFTIGEDGIFKAEMTNKLQELVLNIYKTDGETKKALAGAEFTVYDKDGNELGKITTDKNGQATTRDKIKLYAGIEYNVKETKAPDGYRESNWEKTFISDYDSSIEYHEVNLSVENTKMKGKFELYKVDSVSGNKLAGAEYEIFDESGKSVFKGTTNSDGYLTCELPLGKYSYKETKAPENYVLDEKTYTFEFTEDGQVFTTTQKNEYGGGVTVSQTPETPNRQVTTQDTPNASTGTSRNAAPFALAMTLCVATAIAASKKKKQTK